MQKLKNHADVVANYKDKKQLVKVLKENKFSYYFDNVGEELLDLILLHIKTNGRIALCGAIANYSNHSGRGIKNIGIAISKRLTLQGINFSELMPRAI